MEDSDLYRSPDADIEPEAPETELAGRGMRLIAVLLDGFLGALIVLPVLYFSGFLDVNHYEPAAQITQSIINAIIGMVVFFILNGYLLVTRGQTIGKRIVEVRIVTSADGKLPPAGRLIGLRYILPQIIYLVPLIGPLLGLLDALFIFGSNRRCLHDYLAGTQVIKA